MKKLIGGIIVGTCLPVLGVLLFIRLGGMPVATAGNPLPFERAIAGMAVHAALKGSIGLESPIARSDDALLAGAKVYAANCGVCHGRPDDKPTAIAKGLFPRPPQLFDSKEMVTDDPVGEIFWKVKNGIRLTGMPGFVGSLEENDIWAVSVLLKNADQISDATKHALRSK